MNAISTNKIESIQVHGARVHNLKNVTVNFPRNKLIVVTGVSGSGKSSLTIDTVYAEGQRKYAESLSAYARQFLNRMNKPDVDYIKGLSPAIAIEQKVITRTPRSTVGTMTEIYDYLRLLFARAGNTISPISGKEVKKDDVADVIDVIQNLKAGDKVFILTKFLQQKNRDTKEELNILLQKGFSRLAFESKHSEEGMMVKRIEDLLDQNEVESKRLFSSDKVFVLIDRIIVKDIDDGGFDEDDIHRLGDSIGTAFYEGMGDVYVEVIPETGRKKLLHFCNRYELDGLVFEEPQPNLFSFNNPLGACPTCEGFSLVLGIDPDLVIPDKRLSVFEGAVAPWKGEKLGQWKELFIKKASKEGFPIHKSIADLSKEHYNFLWKCAGGINDFFKEVEQNLYKVQYRVLLSRYRGRTTCPDCNGYRLKKEALYIQVGGRNIGELSEMQAKDLKEWFGKLKLSHHKQEIAKRVLIEINNRLDTLVKVGLGYLSINRVANTLSGGESQRIQLTRSLGSNLTNSLYILDEPSIGLHSRDTDNLIKVLKELRDLDNTVIVVEHDSMMMEQADHIIDMGPLASYLGGEVVAEGDYQSIINNPESLTGKYLNGSFSITPPINPRKWNRSLVVEGARQNNLKDITVSFPLNVLTVVSGVSGSGKTTLVKQILYPALQKLKGEFSGEKIGFHKSISGDLESIQQIEMIDQNPIGKSSRSNPVTYIKAYDEIRDLYAKQPLSKMRGFLPKHFSFNVDGGRCDTCKGEGEQVVEMQFLADVHLICESCGGKRFKEEILDIKYKDKNIHDVLEMSVDESIDFFSDDRKLADALQPLSDVGLGYVKLGQSSDTLSGGEAQRVKLASFLGKSRTSNKVLFIFDEPTTGLHFHDIKKLLASFNALIEQGHSIIVIEHNIDVIKCADWLIELGPDAGDAGGELLFAGKPIDIKKIKNSFTAKYL
ncbi:MAG TPA: excinuclease ABC subunit UvrA [Niabella sp.]|nr:excinuclease ABC subunit UvrA [Niabella sp.]HOZ96619.1 excinuclease ABC subunit UvrA [Niabella sp.]HQW14513.1 excinuclease ABC subunit UvrA [Niabella sp.]HQX19928.1 excinuclease ABC subunit UvrA [Niabella sp.]HQX41195.1 excinuclease ABC subunit UvrA [Niabella sp.]